VIIRNGEALGSVEADPKAEPKPKTKAEPKPKAKAVEKDEESAKAEQ
jgi:hypothetical protein